MFTGLGTVGRLYTPLPLKEEYFVNLLDVQSKYNLI